MIPVQTQKDLLVFSVRVTPRGGRDAILPFAPGDAVIKLKVSTPPEDGKANTAVIALLSETLDLPKRRIRLISGETSRQKRIGIVLESEPAALLLERLATAMAATPSEVFHCSEG